MTIIGSGAGSNQGGPLLPSHSDLNNDNAWTAVNKALSNIMHDTLEIPFSQMNHKALWKYDSGQSRPRLSAMQNTRVGLNPPDTDDSWKGTYQDLMQKLPDNVKNAFDQNAQLPFSQRNPSLVSLSYVLEGAAKFVNWVNKTTTLTSPESPFMEPDSPLGQRTVFSQNMATSGLKQAITEGGTMYTKVADLLTSMSANEPNFDHMLEFARQLGAVFSALTTSSNNIEDGKRYVNISNALDSLSKLYQKTSSGEESLSLTSTFQHLSLLSNALSLQNGSPSLLISLSMASSHLNGSPDEGGVVGEGLTSTLSTISQQLMGVLNPGAHAGNKAYFDLLTLTSILGAISYSSILADKGIGPLPNPENSPVDEQENRFFGLDLSLNMVANSTILDQHYHAVAAATGFSERDQPIVSNVLTTTTLLGTIFSASQGDQNKAEALVMSLKDPLIQHLENLNSFLTDGQLNGKMTSTNSAQLNVYVQQSILALQDENFTHFNQAVDNALNLTGVSTEEIRNNFKEVGAFANSLAENISSSRNDKTNTFTGMQTVI